MGTEIFYYAFVTIWVLAEDVFYYDHDFFNDVLSSNFLPDQLMEGHNTPFRCLLQLNRNSANCRYSLSRKNDINLLGIVFKLVQQLIHIFQICKSYQKIQLRQLHIQRILKVAEEHPYFFFKNTRILHQNQVNVSCRDILNLRLVVHQRDQRRREFSAN
jgi:hypothetical protein